jgi:hypothetical protein
MTAFTQSANVDNRLLTVRAFANAVGLTERQVRHLVKSCGLPSYRVNGIRLKLSDYHAWLETRRSA